MTFLLFFILFASLFFALLNALPTAGALSFAFSSAIAMIWSYMKSWDFIFPISELITMVKIVVSFEIAVLLWKFSRWIIHVIRGTTSA